MTAVRTQVCTGDAATAWARLVVDLERVGLLGGPGACDAVARVGADVLQRAQPDGRTGQVVAP